MTDVCVCGHLLQTHAEDGPCHAPCDCVGFVPETDDLEEAA